MRAGCLEEETLVAMLAHHLAPAAAAAADAHLAGCADCRAVLADAAHGLDTGPADEPVAALPAVGDVIADKYRVDCVLGRGGMGVVLAAHHLELDRRVAVKVLHRVSGAHVARFLREARTSARFTSEHVVRVFDVGRLTSGAPYIVMEHLVGSDLAKVLADRGPLPVAEAIAYVQQACAGLAEAHAAKVVHRDLKPANLFVTRRLDGRPLLKVLDFGVSKLLEEDEGSLSLTATDAVVGSPRYMSPEQLRASKSVDERTDVWSLGVILYQLVGGAHPFNGPSFSAVALAVATEDPPPLRETRGDVPAAVEACVARCLAKKSDDRYPDVLTLSRALEAALVDPAADVKHVEPNGSLPWRRPVLVAAFLACAALVAIGVALFARATDRRTEPAAVAPALPALAPAPPSTSSAALAPAPVPDAPAAPLPAPPASAARRSTTAKPRRPARAPEPGPTDTPD